ncbi:MAG: sporulation initiation factor Spo0A C-terminal domain-containing protein, partial [Eubacteriales bacterium]|nr:sporulation initiation factor Spo0A C-terminal domain-containing protein [Eubacteriales bacterium]
IRLVSHIAPSIQFTGCRQFTFAIYFTYKMYQNDPFQGIHVTKDIYPSVANECEQSLTAAERAVYRAVETCWMDGKNQALNEIIGRLLPVKPSPAELILYCAYYLAYGTPYHQIISSEIHYPMPF